MKLSNDFTLEEFTRSDRAIRLGIENIPTPILLNNIKDLVTNVLQPLREFTKKGITITSGFRSDLVNSKTPGSSKTSQHNANKGAAADIVWKGDNAILFNYIKDNLTFDLLIWEFGTKTNPSWVHVSYNKNRNRKEVLRAEKTAQNTTKYSKY